MGVRDQLQIEVRHEPGRVVVCLRGELDLASVPRLEEEIDAIELGSARTVVFDLRGLEFMDSTGLRALLSARARLQESGGELVVTRTTPQVQRLLEITRAGEYLPVLSAPDEMLV